MTADSADASAIDDRAERVVVSVRPPKATGDERDDWWVADSDWLEESVRDPTYRRYLRRAHAGTASVGDEWEEFVNCGCASPEDVILRVERVEGGTAIGPETTIEILSREEVVGADGAEPTDRRQQ